MKVFFALALFLIICSGRLYAQTCIVIKMTNKSVVVGADSRVKFYKATKDKANKVRLDSALGLTCKIEPFGKYFLTIAGFRDSIVTSTLKDAFKKGKTFKAKDSIFEYLIKPKLDAEYAANTAQGLTFNRAYSNHPLEIAVFGVESKVPFIYLVEIRITEKTIDYNSKLISANKIKEGHHFFVVLGRSDVIENLRWNNSQWDQFWDKGSVKGIEYLINLEAKAHPTDVSKPISIIEVSPASGGHWLEKSNCASP